MTSPAYRFGEFTLVPGTRELKRGDQPIALSPRAFDCLVYLAEHRDRAVGKDELVAAIWERVDVSDTQLGQAVLRARRAVDDDGQVQNVIRTVSRFGYRWVADVEVLEGEAVGGGEVAGGEDAGVGVGEGKDEAVPARRRRVRIAVGVSLVVLAVAAIAIGIFMVRAPSRGPALTAAAGEEAAVVLPLQVAAGEESAWLRLGAMDLVAERLRAGGLAVPPSESVVALLQSSGEHDEADAMRAIRGAEPDALIVSGELARTKQGWSIELKATAADGATLDVESTRADALDAAREGADRLLQRLGRAHPPGRGLAGGLEERLQRAQAAMLANDLDTARAILVSDPELARSEPELVYRLAMIDFRAGEYKRADASLTSLLAEPAARDPMFRARVLDGRGAVRIRQDQYPDAERDYDAAIALLKDSGNAAELGRALTGRGVSRAMRRNFAPALADLGQARAQLEAAGDVLAIARVDTDLGALEMNRDRPEAAIPYLEHGAKQFERFGAINELIETLASLVSNHLTLLQPAEALAASDRSWALLPRITDPNQRLNVALDRVDVFLALGRFREAASMLGTLPEDAPDANPFVARRLHVLRARLALATSDDARAIDEAKRALALPPPSDDLGEGVAEIARVYQRAVLASASARAKPDRAPASTWIDFDAPPRYPVEALVAAEWSAWRGDEAAAGERFRHALDMAEQRGEPADIGDVTAAFGPWLLAHGRLDEAGDVIGRVSPWADRDYASALLQVRLFHALGRREAWRSALAGARALAGERRIPDALQQPPVDGATAAR